MSDIPRYRPVANDKYGITDDVDGKLCEYRDYARLKAESIQDAAQLWQQSEELKRLRASSFVTAVPAKQYELVIKAGDAMAEGLFKYIEPTDGYLTYLECRANWNAAKEGKPSV
jgi:hypothetical protein